MPLFLQKAYIDGEFIVSDNSINSFSPINNEIIGNYPALSKLQIDDAFQSAENAFLGWSNLNYNQRIIFIKKFRELLLQDKEFLSNLMVLEIGKSKKDALVEIERTVEYIDKTIEWYKDYLVNPWTLDELSHNIRNKVGYFYNVPIGVVLAIAPFNYPVNLSIAKIIPALIVGNTVVFKPSSQSTLIGLQLAKYFSLAFFPNGVINIISGQGSEIGDYIVQHKSVKGITFTGGSKVGKRIATLAPMKNLVLELGGKDPAIVLPDVYISSTAKEIVKGAFNYSGQRCTAIKRVLVQNSIADQLVLALKMEISNLSIGDPFKNVDIVPLINESSVKYMKELIADAIEHGAKIVCGGKDFGVNLFEPTLIDNVSLDSRIAREEPFGPILPIIRVESINEMIKIANQSEYGLQASIFTKNIGVAKEIAKQLDCGTININRSSSRGPDVFPFVGIKDSGFGSQGILDAMKAMTRIKGIVENND